MSSPLHIVWFKRDLRIADHRPLARAATQGAVLPLYIAESDLWAQGDASARQWEFAAESLSELQKALAALGRTRFGPMAMRSGWRRKGAPPSLICIQSRATNDALM